jgi:hypothetical protein
MGTKYSYKKFPLIRLRSEYQSADFCRNLAIDGIFWVMAGGSLHLHEYPADMVRLSCEKCGRAGQYQKANLIERFGPDIRLPDLREEIAQCERHGKMHDACMVHYVDLIPPR